MEKSLNAFYCHLNKHYSVYSFLANLLLALSYAGLALIGVLNSILDVKVLAVSAFALAGAYLLGKWLNQEVDDIDKIKEHMPNDCRCDKGQGP